MFFISKLLPALPLALLLSPLAAQARNGDTLSILQSNTTTFQSDTTQMKPVFWETKLGFQPTNCKHAVCTDVQKGFWPRQQ